MKKRTILCLVFCCAFLAALPSLAAQSFELLIKNQHVSDNIYEFDIYMANTGSEPLYLGDCDLVLKFNDAFFDNHEVSISNPTSGKLAGYAYDAFFLEESTDLMVIMEAPLVGDREELEQFAQQIPVGGEEVFIVHCVIKEIADQEGTAGLSWAVQELFSPQISVFQTVAPFQLFFINEAGRYEDPVDYPLDGSNVTSVRDGSAETGLRLEVQPNPVQSDFVLRVGDPAVRRATLEIYSLNGVVLYSSLVELDNGRARIELPHTIAGGTYILSLADAAGSRSRK